MRPTARLVLATAAALATAAPAAAQTTLRFDDVTTGATASIPDGYGGLRWENFAVQDATRPFVGGTGFGRGTVSPMYAAFNGGGAPAELYASGLFDLNGAYLTAAFNDGLAVRVTGYRGADLLFTRLLTLDDDGPTHVAFDFLGVDRVRFESSGGVDAGTPGTGTHFVLDDLVVTSPSVVPEPSTVALLATGLAGLGLVARRRRRASPGPRAR